MIILTNSKFGAIFLIFKALLLCHLVSAQQARLLSHDAFPEYKIELNKPQLCNETAQQYSGYLHVNNNIHLFFWFFESRNQHPEDPIVLWLNGGPGCSSLTGLYFELGPCSINPGAVSTTFNPYSWNNKANIFFLDQPANTGYSYGDDISNTSTAADNVYAFLQIFFQEFPKYANLDFHIAGESYPGHYIPAIASDITEYNNNNGSRKDIAHINLESILIGNGWVNPLVQYQYYEDMACNSSYGRVLDNSTCSQMRQDYTQCAKLINKFYHSNNTQDLKDAQDYCESNLFVPYLQTGRNPYDIRDQCDSKCYPGLNDIDKYSNRKDVKTLLGVNSSLTFKGCNDQIFNNFLISGDYLRPFDIDIPLLLGSNIRVLIYAGDADFICNWFGNEAWTTPWITNSTGEYAGDVKTFKGLTFLKVFKAGHLVPHDQPVTILDFFNRWISKHY